MTLQSRYVQDGFVSPIDIMEAGEVQRVRAAFDAIEATFDPKARSTGMLHLHLQNEVLWQLATHPRLLNAAAEALGPDLVLLGTHFFVKYSGQVEAYVAWHQDATYWGLDPAVAVTAWVAIDDADAENGCMRVIRASHRRGLLEHGKAQRSGNLLSVNQSLELEPGDESQAIDVVLRAGQASLHDGLLIHGSNPNRSSRRRAGFTVRLTRSDVNLQKDPRHKHAWKPMLVRGSVRGDTSQLLDLPFAAARN